MRAAVECDSQSGRAELGVVSGQAMVTNAAHGYRVYVGGVTVAVTVVVRQSAIPRCPHVDVSFTISSLEGNDSYREHFAVRMVWVVGCLKLAVRELQQLCCRLCCLAIIKPVSRRVCIACSVLMITSILQSVNRLDASCFIDLQKVCKCQATSSLIFKDFMQVDDKLASSR